MSWHVHSGMGFAYSDAYGVDTDNPESAAEIIENTLTKKDEEEIASAVYDFKRELASVYFNTSHWDDEWWDAWFDIV